MGCPLTDEDTDEEIAELIENSYNVFESYERLNISRQSIESSAGITTCYVSGAVIYTDDQSWPFEAPSCLIKRYKRYVLEHGNE